MVNALSVNPYHESYNILHLLHCPLDNQMIMMRRETAVLKTSLKTGAERAKEACTPRFHLYDDDNHDNLYKIEAECRCVTKVVIFKGFIYKRS